MSKTKAFVYPPTGLEHYGSLVDSIDGFDVIECECCGFKHIIPIPTPQKLDDLYKDRFYSTEKPRYFKEAEEDIEWWEMTYRNYYKLFESHLSKNSRRLLEVGSGPGYFLKCGKELGWSVVGFEPSKQAYEYSQRFDVEVINKFFDKRVTTDHDKFDVVYMNMVIEHLPDPLSLIKAVKEALRPDGIICIIAPNDYNPLQKIARNDLCCESWWIAPPQHINYFDFESIARFLGKADFDIVESMATFPMEFFLLSGDNYLSNNEVGRECHSRRKMFEVNMYKNEAEYLNKVYRDLASNGIGREFLIIGRLRNNG